MTINLTPQEKVFLVNLLLERRRDPLQGAPPEQELATIYKIMDVLAASVYFPDYFEVNLDQQQVGYLQYMLQEQNEIWGSSHTTANEKSGLVGPGQHFVAHNTLVMIKSISDKLGAHLKVDIDTKSDQTSPRGEGSISIMNWLYPYQNKELP